MSHMIRNLSIGIDASGKHLCTIESQCVSFNIGPPTNGRIICHLRAVILIILNILKALNQTMDLNMATRFLSNEKFERYNELSYLFIPPEPLL